MLDLVYLGMGADGHTASIFPGSVAELETDRLVIAHYVARVAMNRLTCTLPVLNTARKILLYTLVLWAATLLFYDVGGMGDIYLAAAFVLGGVFTYHAVRLRQQATSARAMRLFGWSISYVTLLFGAMALDQLVHVH